MTNTLKRKKQKKIGVFKIALTYYVPSAAPKSPIWKCQTIEFSFSSQALYSSRTWTLMSSQASVSQWLVIIFIVTKWFISHNGKKHEWWKIQELLSNPPFRKIHFKLTTAKVWRNYIILNLKLLWELPGKFPEIYQKCSYPLQPLYQKLRIQKHISINPANCLRVQTKFY